jgi:hypothetical protein
MEKTNLASAHVHPRGHGCSIWFPLQALTFSFADILWLGDGRRQDADRLGSQ